MNLSYMVPLFLGLLVNLYVLFKQQAEAADAERNIIMTRPFKSIWSNELYALSFSPLFANFINDDENHEVVLDTNKMIAEAELSDIMDYRVLTVLKIIIMLVVASVTLITFLLSDYTGPIVNFLFGFPYDGGRDMTFVYVVGIIGLFMIIIPNRIVKSRSNKNKVGFQEDLPILQLFIVLLLGANRPIGEVMYILSKTDMRYNSIFSTAYRIYLRDRSAAFEYLRQMFNGTHFTDTIDILATYQDYSKKDSLAILKNNMKILQEDVINYKKGKNVGKNLFTEGSIALPFVALMALGVAPIIVYALGMMSSAQNLQ